jgi:hypothetical protein
MTRTTTTTALAYEQARRYLAWQGRTIHGYTGLGHTGWHRFTVDAGRTIDVRRSPTTGKIETR